MGDPYRELRAGDGPIPQAALNAAVRGGLAALRARGGIRSGGQVARIKQPATEVLVKWTGEDPLPVRSVVTYAGGTVIDQEDKPLEVAESPIYEGGTPADSGDAFAILIEPCRVNGFARAVSMGHAVVDIDITDEDHTHASATPDETAYLTSSTSGRAEIIDKPEGTGVLRCTVLLSGGGGESCCSCVGVDAQTGTRVPDPGNHPVYTPHAGYVINYEQYVDVPGDVYRIVMGAAFASSNNGVSTISVRVRMVSFDPSTGAMEYAYTGWVELLGSFLQGNMNQRSLTALLPPGDSARVAFQYDVQGNTNGIVFVGGYPESWLVALPASTLCSNDAASPPAPPVAPPPPPNTLAPVAAFTHSPQTGFPPLAVGFVDESTNTPTEWSWDFGDGAASNVQHPVHIYTAIGTYTVTLTASNAYGSSTAKGVVIVTRLAIDPEQREFVAEDPPAKPFSARLLAEPAEGTVPFTVLFGSDVQGGSPPYTYAIDFGDGTVASTESAAHEYTTGAPVIATLTVTDGAGAVIVDRKTITATAPVAAGDGSLTASFSSIISGVHGGGTDVTFTDTSGTTGGAITSWAWTFGDGGTSTAQNPVHTYAAPGTYTVTLTVSHATDSDTANNDVAIP